MDINGAVADDDVRAPYLVEDFLSGKDFAGLGYQQVKQFEFLFGQFDDLFSLGNGDPVGSSRSSSRRSERRSRALIRLRNTLGRMGLVM